MTIFDIYKKNGYVLRLFVIIIKTRKRLLYLLLFQRRSNFFSIFFFLFFFFSDWEKDFRSDSTFLPNNQVPLTRIEITPRPPTAGCSFGFDEIALPLYLKAKSKCVLVEFRPRSKPHISKTLGRTLRFPLLRNSFELIGAFVTNVIVALPSVRVWCAKTYDQRFVQDWYIKLIDTCVIVIDPNFTIVIKFRRFYKLLFRFNIKILLCNDYEHLWIPCVHEFLEKYFHFLIIYIRILMKCFFNTCFILLYSYKDYRYY